MDPALYSISLFGISFVVFLSLKPFDRRLTYVCGMLFAVYVGLDDLVTGLPASVAEVRLFNGGQWNWSGKIYSLLLSAALIFGLGLNRQAIGLQLPRHNTAGLIALIPLVLLGVVLGRVFQPSPPSPETLAFQALMPTLAEELAYRGIAPALLLGLTQRTDAPRGVPWVVICIAAVPYAVVHGLSYDSGAFSLEPAPLLYTYSGGIIYGWLRFSTGSLVYPLLAHGGANVAFHLAALAW